MTSSTIIGAGFPWRANKAAFVQAPTGLALDANGTLYVAETIGSSLTAITDAATGSAPVSESKRTIITSKVFLNGPLGLTLAPDGDLIAANGATTATSSRCHRPVIRLRR